MSEGSMPTLRGGVLTVMMGRRASYIDGINPTIYYYKNSHSHMSKSHDWLVQLTPTRSLNHFGSALRVLWSASKDVG